MPMMRRRPLARAAIVGGTAYAAGKHSQAGAQQDAETEARLEQLEAQSAPPPAAAPAPAAGGMTDDTIQQLKDLAALHEQGVLTDEEFAAQKQKILGG